MAMETYLRFDRDANDPAWLPGWVPKGRDGQPRELAELTQSDFLWYNFLVRSDFKITSVDFSIKSPPLCLLDHVLMLRSAKLILQRRNSAELELSDRSGKWYFERRGESVDVRTRGYGHHGAASCTVDLFAQLADQSLVDALAIIFASQPKLQGNTYLGRLADDASKFGLTPSPSVE